MLHVNAYSMSCRHARVFLYCICSTQRSTTLDWPVYLAGGRCQALLRRELQYLQTITVGTRRNRRRRDPSRGKKIKESVRRETVNEKQIRSCWTVSVAV